MDDPLLTLPTQRFVSALEPRDPRQRAAAHAQLLAAILAVILALILLAATFAPGFVRSIFQGQLPVRMPLAFAPFIAYELFAAALLTILLRRGRNFPVVARYANALIETSFQLCCSISSPDISRPPIFGAWPALLYFLFIILSTLRLDFALSAFAGTVAAVKLSPSPLLFCTPSGKPTT